jgi:hypothetical protein
MQKHKFPITFRDVVFMGAALGPPEHEKYCIDIFTPQMHPIVVREPQIARNAKTQVHHNISQRAFYGIHIFPTRA